MLLMTDTERTGPQPEEPPDAGLDGEDEDRPGPSWYERAQRRLRVDGVAFGQAITRLREAEGWSIRGLSKRSGVPPTTLAKLERGETPKPDVEVATALALTFGYGNPGSLLGTGATAKRPGQYRNAEEREGVPAALTLEKLIESLLRAIRAAGAARPGEALVTEPLPDIEGGARVAEEVQRLPAPAGMNLYVPLVVLVEPRTVG
jgi:transcriptional regulator with XRE-family HTH domain